MSMCALGIENRSPLQAVAYFSGTVGIEGIKGKPVMVKDREVNKVETACLPPTVRATEGH